MADTVATPAGKVEIESPVGELYPIIPQNTGRYDVGKKVKRSEMTISAGMFVSARTLPQYLPEQWSALTHPEGKPYFTREGSPRAVTSDNMYDSQIADKITAWISRIHKEVASKGTYVPESSELFLQLEDDDCWYYFADHTARTLFWLDDYAASDLGLLDVVSESNMKYQLEEHYWTHVDYHCMHKIPFQVNIVEEMIGQLIHASGDQLTSSVSTFPYTFQECKRFLKLLVPARDRPIDGHVVSLVARIASVVAHNRYWTSYGQEQARLSRDSAILEEDEQGSEWAAKASSAVTLRTADFFRNRLNTIFTDNYVYVTDWQNLMSAAMAKWKGAFAQSLGLLMLHLFCFFLPVSQPLAIGSAAALGSSMLSSALLIHQHQDLEKANAGAAFRYLSKHKKSSLGFTGLGLVMGLPQALNLYGLLLTFFQPFAILLEPSSYQISVTLVALVALLSVACGVKVLSSLLRGRTLTFSSEPPSKESDASSV